VSLLLALAFFPLGSNYSSVAPKKYILLLLLLQAKLPCLQRKRKLTPSLEVSPRYRRKDDPGERSRSALSAGDLNAHSRLQWPFRVGRWGGAKRIAWHVDRYASIRARVGCSSGGEAEVAVAPPRQIKDPRAPAAPQRCGPPHQRGASGGRSGDNLGRGCKSSDLAVAGGVSRHWSRFWWLSGWI
jgi:hypothetical protein